MTLENEKLIWIGLGIAIVLFLVVTTPGWKEVLGIGNLNLGQYGPAFVILGIMGGLVAIAFMGGGSEED